ncbi:hypothetical protein [Paenibacillus sp. FSL H3-0286]|uniref:hypothetical protein n=1 Tax=Paenibacillus sp. FSL H3-0286 TaxID=2921427 RepID=UPI003245FA6C
MPIIKNNQYADILVHGEHIGEKKDKFLKQKYYRYYDGHLCIKLFGVFYILKRYEHGLGAFYETTGEIIEDTYSYQIENKKLPLVWKRGATEVRQKDENVLTIDCGFGWIVEASKNHDGKSNNEKVLYSEKVIISNFTRDKIYKLLWS